MLLQMLIQRPRMLVDIVHNTPAWVWGLFAALMALGISQMFPRRAGQWRTALMPVTMTVFALFGLVSAFAGAGQAAMTAVAWLLGVVLCTALALWQRPHAQAGTQFDRMSRHFQLPGSVIPLLLILAIFLTKYYVGVELAIAPQLAREQAFALTVAGLYGIFNGIFADQL